MGSGRQQVTPKAIYIANIIPIVEIDENQKKLTGYTGGYENKHAKDDGPLFCMR